MAAKIPLLEHLKALAQKENLLIGQVAQAASDAAEALEREKQDKLTGAEGQFVGFDENQNAVPVDAPSGGGGGGSIPSGVIVIWSGAAADIPDGWALCDGQNGTPDLSGRFVLGAGGSYGAGAKGGEETHTLTVQEMPEHAHDFSKQKVNPNTNPEEAGGSPGRYALIERYNSTSTTTTYTGGSQPHNNMPPYYVLCYIMKI